MIKPYRASHRPRLLEIFRLNTPTYFDVNEQADYEKHLDEYGDLYFVVEENGEVVGAGGYHLVDQRTGRISWDLFHPDHKGKGHGRSLILHCIEALKKEAAITRLVVMTSQLAEAFYGKFGFHTIGIEKDHWGKGLDLYRMEMDLGRS